MQRLTVHFNTISVKKGETFAVELQSIPTTGYLWNLDVVTGKAKLIEHTFNTRARGDTVHTIGGSGRERWVFIAEESGVISIEASHSRPWESKPPIEKRSFKINVE